VIGDILQPTHLLFVLVVALLVLGPKRLPEVGRSLGKGLRDFRSALSGEETHNETITETTVPPTEPQDAHTEPVEEPVATHAEAVEEPAANTRSGEEPADSAQHVEQPPPAVSTKPGP
jgi:sec-independent protein translocase protein TatA